MGVAAFELGVGLSDLRQRVDVRDGHLKMSVGDQAGQFGEHLGAGPGCAPPVGLHPVLRRGREIGDGIDPLGRDTEGEGQLDVPLAEGVDEGVDAARRGGPDPVRDSVTVGDRDHAVALQPLVVALTGQADDRGPGPARDLNGQRADAPGGSGDDDGLALLGPNGVHRPPRGHADDVQAAGHLP